MKFFTADNHFNHHNIIKYCNRPFSSVEDMNEVMIERWNEVIKDGDVVYHLGDFSFIDPEPYVKRLNGHIILIEGNHDNKKHKDRYSGYFKNTVINVGNNICVLNHVPVFPDSPKSHVLNLIKKSKSEYVICGHVHGTWKVRENHINVGVDFNNFYPMSEDELLCEIKYIKEGKHDETLL